MKEGFKKTEKGPETKRSLNEIVSLNNNGDSLIKLLKLEDLKASPDVSGKIFLMNKSGTLKYEIMDNGRYIQREIKELNYEGYKKYPLVDLGTNGEAEIAIFAQRIGVSGVVAVDIGNQIKIDSLNKAKKSGEYKDKNFPVLGLNIDMLELLKQLPDNSCNVSLFSIPESVLTSQGVKKEDLLKQLYRVIPEDGIIIVFGSILDMGQEEKFLETWKNLQKEKGIKYPSDHIFRKIVKQ